MFESPATYLESIGDDQSPVAIGGIGGSGTRVVAEMLQELGFFLGADLNGAVDNLWFTLLFKRAEILVEQDAGFEQLVKIFLKGMRASTEFTEYEKKLVSSLASVDRPQQPALWLRKRVESLLASSGRAPIIGRWGWKEPNTHIVIDRLCKTLPTLKYIHVIRNGLDMAHSKNQNQLQLWGPLFLEGDVSNTPRNSLRFWHVANRRVIERFGDMSSRFHLLSFDRLCQDPKHEIEKLLAFVAADAEPVAIQKLVEFLHVPSSQGRFKKFGLVEFDSEDVDFVRYLGFETDSY